VNAVGEPVNPAAGNVYKTESDIRLQSLMFERYYNSVGSGGADLGGGWRHSYTRTVTPNYSQISSVSPAILNSSHSSNYINIAAACTSGFAEIRSQVSAWQSATASLVGGVCAISSASGVNIGTLPVYLASGTPPDPLSAPVEFDVTRDDGQIIRFAYLGGVITAPPGIELRLQQTVGGFTLTDGADNTETYDATGRLLSIRDRSGVAQTVGYDANSRLSAVTDSFGYVLTLAYDAQNRLASVTDPSGHAVQYGFDASGRLSTVTSTDSTVRTYLYENGAFPNALTGMNDESGLRFSTWGYDTQGRGTSTQEAGGADAVTLVYNADGSVTTTEALGAVRVFTYGRVGDRNLPVGISGSKCPTCREGNQL
jgi:YD repeat-containing protein